METIFLLPPDPLHVNLLEKMEEIWPCEMMQEFYPKHNLKKSGGGPGGQFNGPAIKAILKEEYLIVLEIILPNFEEASYEESSLH